MTAVLDAIRVDLRGDGACGHGPDCIEFVAAWERWMAKNARRPLAILDCRPGYRERLGRNGRQMLNKADRLYSYRPIVRNDHLAAMHAVNTSAEVRQGRVMSAAYREPLEPSQPARLCGYHSDSWHAGFDGDGRLVVYARAEMFGDLCIPNTLISDRAAPGAMNGMIAYLAELPDVRWLNYLRLESATESLTNFKVRTGFAPVRVLSW